MHLQPASVFAPARGEGIPADSDGMPQVVMPVVPEPPPVPPPPAQYVPWRAARQVPMASTKDHALRVVLGLVLSVATLVCGWQVVEAEQMLVITLWGKVWRVVREPGLYFFIPWGCKFHRYTTRESILEVSRTLLAPRRIHAHESMRGGADQPQSCIVTAMVSYCVEDALAVHMCVDDLDAAVRVQACAALNAAVADCPYDSDDPSAITLRHHSKHVSEAARDVLVDRLASYGVALIGVEVRAVPTRRGSSSMGMSPRMGASLYESPWAVVPSVAGAVPSPTAFPNPFRASELGWSTESPMNPPTKMPQRAVGTIAVVKFYLWAEESAATPWDELEGCANDRLALMQACVEESGGSMSAVVGGIAVASWGLQGVPSQHADNALRFTARLYRRVGEEEGDGVVRAGQGVPFYAGLATGLVAMGKFALNVAPRGVTLLPSPTLDTAFALAAAAAECKTCTLVASLSNYSHRAEPFLRSYVRPVDEWSFTEGGALRGSLLDYIASPRRSSTCSRASNAREGSDEGTWRVAGRTVVVHEVHVPRLMIALGKMRACVGEDAPYAQVYGGDEPVPSGWGEDYALAFFRRNAPVLRQMRSGDAMVERVCANLEYRRHMSHGFMHLRANDDNAEGGALGRGSRAMRVEDLA